MVDKSVIAVSGLGLSLDGRMLLDDISFSLGAGSGLALVGESGAGKSLLATVIPGLLSPYQPFVGRGTVSCFGEETATTDFAGRAKWRGRKIGFLFQEPHSALNPLQTVGKQLTNALLASRGLTRLATDAEETTAALVTRLALPPFRYGSDDDFWRRYPHQLSGGQKQRILLAMALAGEAGGVDSRRTHHCPRPPLKKTADRFIARDHCREEIVLDIYQP